MSLGPVTTITLRRGQERSIICRYEDFEPVEEVTFAETAIIRDLFNTLRLVFREHPGLTMITIKVLIEDTMVRYLQMEKKAVRIVAGEDRAKVLSEPDPPMFRTYSEETDPTWRMFQALFELSEKRVAVLMGDLRGIDVELPHVGFNFSQGHELNFFMEHVLMGMIRSQEREVYMRLNREQLLEEERKTVLPIIEAIDEMKKKKKHKKKKKKKHKKDKDND